VALKDSYINEFANPGGLLDPIPISPAEAEAAAKLYARGALNKCYSSDLEGHGSGNTELKLVVDLQSSTRATEITLASSDGTWISVWRDSDGDGLANSRTVANYDPANTQPYKTLTTTTDALNRVDKIDTVFDDNHRVLKDFDEKNVNATAHTETTYDAQARVDLVSVVNDNSSSTATDYDQANTSALAYQITTYNVDHSFSSYGLNDNGTAWSQNWDTQGRLDYGYTFATTGAVASVTDYDQSGIYSWKYNTTTYNADHSSTQYGPYDNGTKTDLLLAPSETRSARRPEGMLRREVLAA
jgi:hypothetical protein